MAHLIDKDALVAEIEKLRKKNDDYKKPSHIADVCYKEILSLIDTLEVKEVDLEKEETKIEWLQELHERLDSLSKEDFEKVWDKYKLHEEGHVDYDKLNTMLDESLSTETKESWNDRLGEETVSAGGLL